MLASMGIISTVGPRLWYCGPRKESLATGVVNLAISIATALTRGADAEVVQVDVEETVGVASRI